MGGKNRYSGWCQHCRCNRCNRPRKLCRTCYYAPGVKDLYPISTAPTARRGHKDFNGTAPLPTDPQPNIWPGTPEKEALMAGRAKRGERLHHPSEPDVKQVSHESQSDRSLYHAHAEFARLLVWARPSLAEVYV